MERKEFDKKYEEFRAKFEIPKVTKMNSLSIYLQELKKEQSEKEQPEKVRERVCANLSFRSIPGKPGPSGRN